MKCGTKLPDDSVYCIKCGYKLPVDDSSMRTTSSCNHKTDMIMNHKIYAGNTVQNNNKIVYTHQECPDNKTFNHEKGKDVVIHLAKCIFVAVLSRV
ncbi:zinc-ribbon domain-containing protein [Anaerovibrio lipolyticus]|uniref:zinc-ribbon domain-containing protein n=1 Tax=Anaerovibrio lipolyticus TaxID=82374 RepID=UPI003AFA3EED